MPTRPPPARFRRWTPAPSGALGTSSASGSPALRPHPHAGYELTRGPGHRRARTRPGRRPSPGGAVAGALGFVAGIIVLAVLALTALGGSGGGGITAGGYAPGARTGTRTAATASPLYRSGPLTAVGCRVPEIEEGDPASMDRFLNALTGCLDRSWHTQFGKTDLPYGNPERVYWDTPGSSPCGSYPAPGAAAFYCPVNNTMYIGLRHVVETAGNEPVSHYAVYARVVAHEYGHHVQERSGILSYGYRQMRDADPGDRLELSRRIELQAQCFAGAFLGAERDTLPMTPGQYRRMISDVRGRGDDRQPPHRRDHGSGRHYASWVALGFRQRELAVCNTWTSPPSSVS